MGAFDQPGAASLWQQAQGGGPLNTPQISSLLPAAPQNQLLGQMQQGMMEGWGNMVGGGKQIQNAWGALGQQPGMEILRRLGFSQGDIDALNKNKWMGGPNTQRWLPSSLLPQQPGVPVTPGQPPAPEPGASYPLTSLLSEGMWPNLGLPIETINDEWANKTTWQQWQEGGQTLAPGITNEQLEQADFFLRKGGYTDDDIGEIVDDVITNPHKLPLVPDSFWAAYEDWLSKQEDQEGNYIPRGYGGGWGGGGYSAWGGGGKKWTDWFKNLYWNIG